MVYFVGVMVTNDEIKRLNFMCARCASNKSSSATAMIDACVIALLNLPKRLTVIYNARKVIEINKAGKVGYIQYSFHQFIMNETQAFVRLIFR